MGEGKLLGEGSDLAAIFSRVADAWRLKPYGQQDHRQRSVAVVSLVFTTEFSKATGSNRLGFVTTAWNPL